jgi:hypothetical protein
VLGARVGVGVAVLILKVLLGVLLLEVLVLGVRARVAVEDARRRMPK